MGINPIVKTLYRRRLGLAPVYVTTGVVTLGEVSQYAPFLPVSLSTAGLGLACASWINTHGGDSRHKAYLYTVLGASASAVLTLHEIGWTNFDWTAMLAAGIGAALGIPWWRNNRRRVKVTVEATVDRWPALAQKLSMQTVTMTDVHAHSGGNIEGRLIWPAGDHTVTEVLDKRERIEGALDLPAGSLRMERDGRDSNSVLFKAFRTDPHANTLMWQIPTQEIDGELYIRELDALDPITLGYREDGQLKDMTLTDKGHGSRSVLLAGSMGSGKSGLLNNIVGTRVCSFNAVVWGIDLKGGMELGPWSDAMDWVVTSFDEAILMIKAVESIIEARARYCAEKKIRKWPMDADHPILTVVVDECHSLNGSMKREQLEMLERVVQKSRAVGVEIIEATQFPTLASLGSNLVRQQLSQRFCFRMQDTTGEYFVFGGTTRVGANQIPENRPGTCYFQSGEKLDRLPLRVLYLDDDTVAHVVRLRQGRTCPLDDVSRNAVLLIVPEYAERDIADVVEDVPDSPGHVPGQRDSAGHVPGQRDSAGQERDMTGHEDTTEQDSPSWLDGPEVSLADLEQLRVSRMTPEERDTAQRERDTMAGQWDTVKLDEDAAMAALRDTLMTAGADGAGARDLAKTATRSSSWLYPKLREMQDAGQVERTKRGTWAWCGQLAHSK